MRVLVIDDSLSSCRSIGRILIDQAITFCCTNGKEWYEHYTHDKPDIILLDIMMPDISGIEVLKEIRNINKDIPIIMVSAIDNNDQIVECLNLGANVYITKPISAEKVLSYIRQMNLLNSLNDITLSTASTLKKNGRESCIDQANRNIKFSMILYPRTLGKIRSKGLSMPKFHPYKTISIFHILIPGMVTLLFPVFLAKCYEGEKSSDQDFYFNNTTRRNTNWLQ